MLSGKGCPRFGPSLLCLCAVVVAVFANGILFVIEAGQGLAHLDRALLYVRKCQRLWRRAMPSVHLCAGRFSSVNPAIVNRKI